ncbi:hypothetical protein [Nodularia spumigena]|uniref:hypothetical protein n=1 Tax=Nodularia spumigena TaxID=70799 RepID=UPI002B1FFFB0|nr:hypothetical protein [Nodularia spumigena]MEA5556270.1 hypothetical protein [Nodularia spumigena CH309]
MAKQELSSYQRKIVDRYYSNIDTISLTKLQEAVSELYLAETDKKKEKLWKSVETALGKFPQVAEKAGQVVAARDVKGLAELVNRLAK